MTRPSGYVPDDIQVRALRTWYSITDERHFDPLPAVMGIGGEAGEIIDKLKKHIYKPGYEWARDDQLDELGDLLYYLAIRTYQLGITINDLSILNRQKLENGRHGWAEVES